MKKGDAMQYHVTVTEQFEKTITIETSSTEEAIHKVSKLWNEDDCLLDSPPFKGVSYSAVEA